MADRALPDLVSRMRLDVSDLQSASTAAQDFAQTLQEQMGAAAGATDAAASSLSNLPSAAGDLNSVATSLGQVSTQATDLGDASTQAGDSVTGLTSSLSQVQGAAGGVDQVSSSLADLAGSSSDAAAGVYDMSGNLAKVEPLADGAETATKGAGEAISNMGQSAVVTVEALQGVADQLGQVSGLGGLAASALKIAGSEAGGAALGLGVLGFAIHQDVDAYVTLVSQVRDFSRVSGESAQESSRMVAVLGQLQISTDVAARAMTLLSKAATGHADTLTNLGVQIAKTNNGSVDLNQTLLNVADAYQMASTAADKNAIGTAAFGRSYIALIPLLEQGSAGIKQLESQVTSTFNEQDFQRVQRYEIATARLGQSWQNLSAEAGSALVPALADIADAATKGLTAVDNFGHALSNIDDATHRTANRGDLLTLASQYNVLSGVVESLVPLIAPLVAATSNHAGAAKQDASATDTSAQSYAAYRQAVDDATAAMDALDGAIKSFLGIEVSQQQAELGVRSAVLGVADAQQSQAEAGIKLNDAQTKLNDAIKIYGPNSTAAKDAQVALTGAQLDAQKAADGVSSAQLQEESALDRAAQAAVDAAKEAAALAGGSLDAAQQTDVYIGKLRDLAATLSPSDPLRQHIEQTIARLAALSATPPIDLHVNWVETGQNPGVFTGSGAGFTEGRASGGSVIPGRTYTVGEHGPETLVMGTRGGVVIPGTTHADQSLVLHQQVDVPVYLDGAQVGHAVQRQVRRELARSTRI